MKLRVRSLQSKNVPAATCSCSMPMAGLLSHSVMTRSGSAYGRGSSRSASTTLKMVVVTPIPTVSVRTATAEKPGLWISECRAWRMSPSIVPRWSSVLDSKSCAGSVASRSPPDPSENLTRGRRSAKEAILTDCTYSASTGYQKSIIINRKEKAAINCKSCDRTV